MIAMRPVHGTLAMMVLQLEMRPLQCINTYREEAGDDRGKLEFLTTDTSFYIM
jgi:hypothetical protein